jgi:hypothetical protein
MIKSQFTQRSIGRRVAIALGLAVICLPLPVFAQDFAQSIAQQLRDQGYGNVSIKNTWLGRTRISATGATGKREIIVNPTTGEILRDIWRGGQDDERRIIDDDGRKGYARNDDDDDDDDGDDDDGGDDGDDGGGDDSGDDRDDGEDD